MNQVLKYCSKISCFWRHVSFSFIFVVISYNLNLCGSTGNQDMLSEEFDILPLLSNICAEKHSVAESVPQNPEPILDPSVIVMRNESTHFPNTQSLTRPYLNQTLAHTSHVLLDEEIL